MVILSRQTAIGKAVAWIRTILVAGQHENPRMTELNVAICLIWALIAICFLLRTFYPTFGRLSLSSQRLSKILH